MRHRLHLPILLHHLHILLLRQPNRRRLDHRLLAGEHVELRLAGLLRERVLEPVRQGLGRGGPVTRVVPSVRDPLQGAP